jgi:hypothetical protein
VSVNGKTENTSVTVEADPNLHIDENSFREQAQAALDMRNDLNALNAMVERIDSMNQQLASFRHAAQFEGEPELKYASVISQAKSLEQKLKSLEASVYNPKIQHNVEEDDIHAFVDFQGQVQNMANELAMRYGQPPNALARQRMAYLSNQLQQHLQAFNSLCKVDIAAYNKAAMNVGAPTLFAGTPIAVEPAPELAGGAQSTRRRR